MKTIHKSVRLTDDEFLDVQVISAEKEWKDAQTLIRLIRCGLKYWDVRDARRHPGKFLSEFQEVGE